MAKPHEVLFCITTVRQRLTFDRSEDEAETHHPCKFPARFPREAQGEDEGEGEDQQIKSGHCVVQTSYRT